MIRSSLESHLAVVKRQPLLASFFALGVLNNVTYVIMIASSPEIAAQSIGTVYFCAVAPAVAIKFSSQYWFDKVTYSLRMMACAIWMVLGFVLVAFGTSIPTKLLGVVCCSLQSALGEASCLALTTRFPSSERQLLLTGWSSGTGIAGILGYVVVAIYLSVLGLSFEAMLWSALLVLPTAWSYVYMFRIHGKFEDGNDVQGSESGHLEEGTETDESAPRAGQRYALEHHDVITLRKWIKQLLPYSMPLFLVYFAEYACQSGVWITIGFPPDSEEARKQCVDLTRIIPHAHAHSYSHTIDCPSGFTALPTPCTKSECFCRGAQGQSFSLVSGSSHGLLGFNLPCCSSLLPYRRSKFFTVGGC